MKPWQRVAWASFAIAWGGNEFTPLLVMYRTEHHLSAVTVDTLLFAYVLGIVPGLLIGGPLSDRFGRAALMRPAPIIAIAGSLLIALGTSSVSLLLLGRVFCGLALGLAMAVGGSWLKELSTSPFDNSAPPSAGARRAAMSLTGGFGTGALLAGLLAQWAPAPNVLAYLVHIAVTLPAVWLIRSAPETVSVKTTAFRVRDEFSVPVRSYRRFLYVVLPVAPWVFGSAAAAYAVLPSLMTPKVAGAPIAFSALICFFSLGLGFACQSLGRKVDQPGTARAAMVALVLVAAGMGLSAWASAALTIPLTVIAALALGAGFGFALVSGLQEITRMAQPAHLAGLTAVFYSVTYLGFAVPAIMAFAEGANPEITYPRMFIFGLVVALAALVLVAFHNRRHLVQV